MKDKKEPMVILGADDPEMQEIEYILKVVHASYGYAMHNRVRVTPQNAYFASGVHVVYTGGETKGRILVECRMCPAGPADDIFIDHHSPGDSGYGVPPERFLEGSSLGQLLSLMDTTPSIKQRYVCAADHCLGAAYAGHCPEIDPEMLLSLRIAQKADYRHVSDELVRTQINEAIELLKAQDGRLVYVKGHIQELPEAASYLQKAYVAFLDGGKVVIVGATVPEQVQLFMASDALDMVYGDPIRGFAGGYLKDGRSFEDVTLG